jgi:hypothetical protein
MQFQVATLSLSGVIVVGTICLFGLRASEFMQKRKEDIVARHSEMIQTIGGNLAEIEAIQARSASAVECRARG